jgi:hypothetical protein
LNNIFRKRRIDVPLVVVFLIVALVPSLMAQTTGMGALTGRVADASGRALSNVTVTATSVRHWAGAKRNHRDGRHL